MRIFFKYWVYIFVLLLVVVYILSLNDEIYFLKYHQNIWYKDIIKSLKYFILWVLPFYWFLILTSSFLVALAVKLTVFLFSKIKIQNFSSSNKR